MKSKNILDLFTSGKVIPDLPTASWNGKSKRLTTYTKKSFPFVWETYIMLDDALPTDLNLELRSTSLYTELRTLIDDFLLKGKIKRV
jgi:hypothetical protein